MTYNYWKECIEEALEDAEIKASKEQIETVCVWVEGAFENYGLATGAEVVNRNHISPEAQELKELKNKLKKEEEWARSTFPCKDCNTTGIVENRWGRDDQCSNCNGKGRTKFSQ